MAFEDYQKKDHVIIVYTGESKGKTSASIGLMCRALGRGWKVAYVQFIKSWKVGEHTFIKKIQPVFEEQLAFYKGGRGFYNAGELSAKATDEEHEAAAKATYDFALQALKQYDIVICDEINNAVNDGLLSVQQLEALIDAAHRQHKSLCLTGRNFPEELFDKVDIATRMAKIKHHFDEKFLANKGIDY